MTVKITSCSVPGIWYENKIGRTFEAGYGKTLTLHVINNPLFKIRQCDCIEVKDEIKPVPRPHRELITVYQKQTAP